MTKRKQYSMNEKYYGYHKLPDFLLRREVIDPEEYPHVHEENMKTLQKFCFKDGWILTGLIKDFLRETNSMRMSIKRWNTLLSITDVAYRKQRADVLDRLYDGNLMAMGIPRYKERFSSTSRQDIEDVFENSPELVMEYLENWLKTNKWGCWDCKNE